MVRLLRREPVQTGMVRPFWVVVGFSRPANRLLAFWVMLVSVRRPGFGVFPPETPSRSFAANGVLGGSGYPTVRPGWRQRTPLPWEGLRGQLGRLGV